MEPVSPPLPPLTVLQTKVRKQVRRLRRPQIARIRRRELAERRLSLTTGPANVSLEMTARCNLECTHCRRFHFQEEYSAVRGVFGAEAVNDVVGSSGYMDPSIFARCLELVRDTDSVELAGYGEPMMNPHYFDYAHQLKRRGHHVNTITNGTLLNDTNVEALVDNRLDLISVSIDGLHAETLEVVRGVDRDELFAGLERLRKAKEARGLGPGDAPRLCVAFAMARFNIREMPELVHRMIHEFGMWSFFAQNLEVVSSPDVLGPHLLHTDPGVREEALRHVEEAKRLCAEAGIACDIHPIPTETEGWEPPGVPLDDAFAHLAAHVADKQRQKRQYRPLAEIATERVAASFTARRPHDELIPALPPLATARDVVLNAREQRENARCLDFFRFAFVAWNGKVLSCCFERHPVGDLNLATADEVWNGKPYRELRRTFFEKGIGTACGSCSRILD